MQNDNIYWTSDEINILKSLDPSFMTSDEQFMNDQMLENAFYYDKVIEPNKMNYLTSDPLDQNLKPQPYFQYQDVAINESSGNDDLEGAGFWDAFTAVAPMIPSIASSLSNIWKGRGIYLPNRNIMGGLDPKNYMVSGTGKRYYKNLYNQSKKLIKDVSRQNGLDVSGAEIDAELSKNYPRSFQKTVSKSKHPKKTNEQSKYKEDTNRSLARPVAKWALGKLFKGGYKAEKQQILKDVDNLNLMPEKSNRGGLQNIFGKVKNFLTDKIQNSGPLIGSLVERFGSQASNKVSEILSGVFNKIQMKYPNSKLIAGVRGTVDNLIKPQNIQKLAEMGVAALMKKRQQAQAPQPTQPTPSAPPIGSGSIQKKNVIGGQKRPIVLRVL